MTGWAVKVRGQGETSYLADRRGFGYTPRPQDAYLFDSKKEAGETAAKIGADATAPVYVESVIVTDGIDCDEEEEAYWAWEMQREWRND